MPSPFSTTHTSTPPACFALVAGPAPVAARPTSKVAREEGAEAPCLPALQVDFLSVLSDYITGGAAVPTTQ